eukprot:scaffold9711_cov99-Skeletonema_marinoi.AAC.1
MDRWCAILVRRLIIRLIDRAAQGLSNTPRIAAIDRLEAKYQKCNMYQITASTHRRKGMQ